MLNLTFVRKSEKKNRNGRISKDLKKDIIKCWKIVETDCRHQKQRWDKAMSTKRKKFRDERQSLPLSTYQWFIISAGFSFLLVWRSCTPPSFFPSVSLTRIHRSFLSIDRNDTLKVSGASFWAPGFTEHAQHTHHIHWHHHLLLFFFFFFFSPCWKAALASSFKALWLLCNNNQRALKWKLLTLYFLKCGQRQSWFETESFLYLFD